ncbi:MAG: CoA transferase [Deltaproteobacteria bacterium]|jgi:crotonobetainyl-CoA:carnitine CoA-transferase CaiB-like acyl-CoA transferase|nr:CoA transferase [Deltaproteobacteria bacterium]
MQGLRGIRVIDFSSRVAGAYVTKLLADAGADVIKVEPAEGDPLRRWSASHQDLAGEDGALFQFLACSKRSVIGEPGDAAFLELVEGANLVVESFEPGSFPGREWCERFPGLVVLSITPFGQEGPYAGRPSSDLTIQAESGGMSGRGLPSQPPVQCGGRVTDWIGGTFAAVGALAAVMRARRLGQGEYIDFSLCEVMNIGASVYADLMGHLMGRPRIPGPARSVEIPSIEPTSDGWVGFNTNSRQQFNDFCLMIERPELSADEPEWWKVGYRTEHMDEWNEYVRAWTTQRTTAEVVEMAALLRIPVAPVNSGRTVFDHPHFKARGNFVPNPRSGFLQPAPSYILGGERPGPPLPAPRLGEHAGKIEAASRPCRPGRSPGEAKDPELPLAGIRILDATAWWAGPSACQMLAHLGADVIRMEACQKPDGMRMTGGIFFAESDWWERSHVTLAANTNKRGITLNLGDPRGLDLCKRLLETCDIFVENFSPRVVEGFGLDWDSVHALNPRLIQVRMPAFGLSGPWRDNVGFAQTMEQISGLAWMTGHVDDQPRIQRGPCDPLAGMHAAYAALVALAEREHTGEGKLLECTMVEGALNAAAEIAIEWSAYGVELEREGNRGPEGAPQNLYACRGDERWLALAVTDDAQWSALRDELGSPDWASSAELSTASGRRERHDLLDEKLAAWASQQDADEAAERLVARGIPAAVLVSGGFASEQPQMKARGFFEEIEHPVVGVHPVAGPPFRYATVDHWHRTPTPTMGQHNREVLADLGLDEAEIDRLEADEVIGTKPTGL